MKTVKIAQARWLASVTFSVSLLAAQPGRAADVAQDRPTNMSGSGIGQGDRVGNPEEIVVTGRGKSLAGGSMKIQTAPEAISSITADAISMRMPAASILQLSSTIPGVNFGSSDAYGIAVRNYISVRGLDETEIGFLIDGFPGVDQSNFYPFPETYADNENISDLTVTAGNSRLQDPIVSATGGEFIVTVRQPHDALGANFSGSLGSQHARRGFVSLDSGYLGNSGIKAFASVSRTLNDNFIGVGNNRRTHVDFKAIKDWGAGSHSSLFVSYTDVYNARLAPITLTNYQIAKSTGNFDQFTYSGTYPAAGSTNYYRSNDLKKRNLYVSLDNVVDLSEKIKVHVVPYFRYILTEPNGGLSLAPASVYRGNQLVTPVYDPGLLAGGRLFVNTQQVTTQYSEGVNTYLEIDPSPTNHLMAGYWYDRWDNRALATLSPIMAGGAAGFGPSFGLKDTAGNLIAGTNYKIGTSTNQMFIGDTQAFLDNRLKLSLGVRYLFYKAFGTNYSPGTQNRFSANVQRATPRFDLSFEPTSRLQFYANVTTNARMPLAPTTYADVYNVATGKRSNTANLGAKPEYSIGEQIGFRHYGLLNVDVNVFNTHLKDRQVVSLQIINGVSSAQVISAGNETIRGVSGEVSTNRYRGFALYGNAQYLHTRFDDDIPSGADFLPTKGKQMVLSPKWMAGLGLNYEKSGFFANLTYKYVGRQFTTFVNDESMASYQTLDAGIGYRAPSIGYVKSPTLSVNFNNLTKGKYLGIPAAVTTNSFAVTGINGTTIAGSKPTYYVSAPFAAMVTLSIGL